MRSDAAPTKTIADQSCHDIEYETKERTIPNNEAVMIQTENRYARTIFLFRSKNIFPIASTNIMEKCARKTKPEFESQADKLNGK